MKFSDKLSIDWGSSAKILSALVALGMLAYSVSSYLDTRALEATRPLLESQFRLYEEAVSVAGRLATVECAAKDNECIASYEKDCRRFRSLYWGGLAVVEDKQVEQAMIAFRIAFVQKHPQLCEPKSIDQVATMLKPAPTNSDSYNLARASLSLSHCVNASLQRSWDVQLLPDRCKFSPEPRWWEQIFRKPEKG